MTESKDEKYKFLEEMSESLRGSDVKTKFSVFNSGDGSEMLAVVKSGRCYDVPRLLEEIAQIRDITERYRLAAWVRNRDLQKNQFLGENGRRFLQFPWTPKRDVKVEKDGTKTKQPPTHKPAPRPYLYARDMAEMMAEHARYLKVNPSRPGRRPKPKPEKPAPQPKPPKIKRPVGRPPKPRVELPPPTPEEIAVKKYEMRMKISLTAAAKRDRELLAFRQELAVNRNRLRLEQRGLDKLTKSTKTQYSDVFDAQARRVSALQTEIALLESRIAVRVAQREAEAANRTETQVAISKLPQTIQNLVKAPPKKRGPKGPIGSRHIDHLRTSPDPITDVREFLNTFSVGVNPKTVLPLAARYGVVASLTSIPTCVSRYCNPFASEREMFDEFINDFHKTRPKSYPVCSLSEIPKGFYYLLPWAEECGTVISGGYITTKRALQQQENTNVDKLDTAAQTQQQAERAVTLAKSWLVKREEDFNAVAKVCKPSSDTYKRALGRLKATQKVVEEAEFKLRSLCQEIDPDEVSWEDLL